MYDTSMTLGVADKCMKKNEYKALYHVINLILSEYRI